MGKEPKKVCAMIKFRTDAEHEAIASGIKNIIDTALNMAKEMDEMLSMILGLFYISVHTCEEYVYIIIEAEHHFIEDMVGFLNEMIQVLSAQAEFRFEFSVASSMFKNLLKH